MNSCAYTDNDCSQLGERESSLTLPPSCIGNYLGRLARFSAKAVMTHALPTVATSLLHSRAACPWSVTAKPGPLLALSM